MLSPEDTTQLKNLEMGGRAAVESERRKETGSTPVSENDLAVRTLSRERALVRVTHALGYLSRRLIGG
jgi:hypothetical protein